MGGDGGIFIEQPLGDSSTETASGIRQRVRKETAEELGGGIIRISVTLLEQP